MGDIPYFVTASLDNVDLRSVLYYACEVNKVLCVLVFSINFQLHM